MEYQEKHDPRSVADAPCMDTMNLPEQRDVQLCCSGNTYLASPMSKIVGHFGSSDGTHSQRDINGHLHLRQCHVQHGQSSEFGA